MATRNHVTKIMSADPVTRAAQEEAKKATGELSVPDPVDQQKALAANEIDGNGSGPKYTLQPARDAEEEKKKLEAEGKDTQPKGGENPNTVLDDEEKRVQKGGKPQDEDEEQQEASQKEKDSPTEDHMQVTSPKTSAQEDGKDTTKKVERKKK